MQEAVACQERTTKLMTGIVFPASTTTAPRNAIARAVDAIRAVRPMRLRMIFSPVFAAFLRVAIKRVYASRLTRKREDLRVEKRVSKPSC